AAESTLRWTSESYDDQKSFDDGDHMALTMASSQLLPVSLTIPDVSIPPLDL
ncbi:hypothetical protein BGW41_004074, partial [Actinomortierella wolfii]